MASVPTIFVSSSCYDLRQVRATLKGFIESLGYEALVSEFDSFPVQPAINAIENCLKAVDERADLLVLIVGGRYGSVNDQGKSVTNMEYLRARAKGIPIYAFVQRSILEVMSEWKRNLERDFSAVADSPKVFEFVTSLDSEGVWVFPFEGAEEITSTLRKQLAYLFLDSLQIRRRFDVSGLPESLGDLRGNALRMVIDRPILWEYRLFSEIVSQEIAKAKQMRLDLNYQISFGKGEHFEKFEVFSWLRRKSGELGRLIPTFETSINVALQEALGPPGVAGDPEAIVYVGKKLVSLYREAIEWSLDFKNVDVDDDFRRIVELTARMSTNMVDEIEEFSARYQTTLEDALANLPEPGEQRVIDLTLKLTMPDMTELHAEVERINRKYFSD